MSQTVRGSSDTPPTPCANTEPKDHESGLVIGVFRTGDQARVLGEKRGASFFERDPVLQLVSAVLGFVPFERKSTHTYSVTTT